MSTDSSRGSAEIEIPVPTTRQQAHNQAPNQAPMQASEEVRARSRDLARFDLLQILCTIGLR